MLKFTDNIHLVAKHSDQNVVEHYGCVLEQRVVILNCLPILLLVSEFRDSKTRIMLAGGLTGYFQTSAVPLVNGDLQQQNRSPTH